MKRQGLTYIKALFITMLFSGLSGCFFMPFSESISNENKASKQHAKNCPRARIYAMRGFLDVFSTGLHDLTEKIEKKLIIHAKPLSYLEENRLSAFLIKKYHSEPCKTPIVLIGHSYGADEQITVAKKLNDAHVPVALLITLDHTRAQSIPSNVQIYYNINSGKSIVSGIIPWGCSMSSPKNCTRMYEVDLVKNKGFRRVNHFNIDKLPEIHNYIIEIIESEIIQNHYDTPAWRRCYKKSLSNN